MKQKKEQTHRLGLQLGILGNLHKPQLTAPGGIDPTVDDGQRDVHALGAELSGERLGDGALGELSRGEGGEADGAAEGGGRAGDEEGGRVGRVGVYGGQEEGHRLLGEVEEALSVSLIRIETFIVMLQVGSDLGGR